MNDQKYIWRETIAPTQSLLQKWIREKHDIHFGVWWNPLIKLYRIDYIVVLTTDGELEFKPSLEFSTYEGAMEFALQTILNLIKNE